MYTIQSYKSHRILTHTRYASRAYIRYATTLERARQIYEEMRKVCIKQENYSLILLLDPTGKELAFYISDLTQARNIYRKKYISALATQNKGQTPLDFA